MIKLTLREVYEHIHHQFSIRNRLHFETDDELARAATLYAVKTTTKAWREYNE